MVMRRRTHSAPPMAIPAFAAVLRPEEEEEEEEDGEFEGPGENWSDVPEVNC
jgi:hypothetical protein